MNDTPTYLDGRRTLSDSERRQLTSALNELRSIRFNRWLDFKRELRDNPPAAPDAAERKARRLSDLIDQADHLTELVSEL